MNNILHIDSSALGQYSVSRDLTGKIVSNLQKNQNDTSVEYLDLAQTALSHWSPSLSEESYLEQFLKADTVVIGAPMYNFAISSNLKSWIDRIVVAGKTFKYTEQGPVGLVKNKKIIVLLTRGGFYGEHPMNAFDFQEPYLKTIFGFIGIEQIEFIRVEGLAVSEEQKKATLDKVGVAIAHLN